MNVLTRTLPRVARAAPQSPRTFTTLSPLRPTLSPSMRPSISFTPSMSSPTAAPAAVEGPAAAAQQQLDLVCRTSISAHPAFNALGSQIRCGPRNTMHGHTRLIQKRRCGFLKRMRSRTGRLMLQRRRSKGRKRIAM